MKIGTFWQDIVYENLPMLCYRCERLRYREPHCLEGMAEPTTTPPQEFDPSVQVATPHEPTHTSTPWKKVQTSRTHARGRPSEPTPCGKSTLLDLHSSVHPRGQVPSPHAHVQCTPQTGSVIGLECNSATRLAGIYRGKVASHGNNIFLLKPREEDLGCMHDPCKAGCPSLLLQPCDAVLDGMHDPYMASCPSKYQLIPHVHAM